MSGHHALRISLSGGDQFDMAELAAMTPALMRELEALDGILADRPPAGDLPAGAKGDAITLTEVVLTIGSAALGGAMQPMITTLRDWISRQPKGLKLEIRPEGGGTSFSVTGSLDELDPQALAKVLIQTMQPGGAGDAGGA